MKKNTPTQVVTFLIFTEAICQSGCTKQYAKLKIQTSHQNNNSK